MTPLPDLSGLSAEYRRQWREFTTFCTVTDTTALPAATDTVLAYLHEHHGAALGSQRARLAAINAVHRAAGQPEPGRTEPLRRLLNPDRGPRRARAAERVHALLPALPTSGWPAGLFGRRDAVLLTLAAAGLPFTRIAALRQGDVRIDDDAVTIGHQPQLVLPATGDPHRCPVTIVRRWAAVLIHAPHPGVPALLEHHFTRDDAMPPTAPEPDHRHLPLLTGFDWRGTSLALPGHLAALSPAHLAGLAAARHRADALAADLDELFDRLDRETDELLTRTDLLYSRDDT